MKTLFCFALAFVLRCFAAAGPTSLTPPLPPVTPPTTVFGDTTVITPDTNGGVYYAYRAVITSSGSSSQYLAWGDLQSNLTFKSTSPGGSFLDAFMRSGTKDLITIPGITYANGSIYVVVMTEFLQNWALWKLNMNGTSAQVGSTYSLGGYSVVGITHDASGNVYVGLTNGSASSVTKFVGGTSSTVVSTNSVMASGLTTVSLACAGSSMATFGLDSAFVYLGGYYQPAYSYFGSSIVDFDQWNMGDAALVGNASNDPGINYMFVASTFAHPTSPLLPVPYLLALSPTGTQYTVSDTYFPQSGYSGSPPPSYHENGDAIAALETVPGTTTYRVCGTCLGPTYDWNIYETFFNPSSGGWQAPPSVAKVSLNCTLAAIDQNYDYFASQNATAPSGVIYRQPAGTLPGLSSGGASNMPSGSGTSATLTFDPYQLVAGGGTTYYAFMTVALNPPAQPSPWTGLQIWVY